MTVPVKTFIFLIISVAIHYLGKIDSDFLHCFFPIYESIFQHAKIIFYSYILTSGIEFVMYNRNWRIISAVGKSEVNAYRMEYIFNILQNSITIIWIMVLVYYFPSSIIGPCQSFITEFLWAIIATSLTGFLAFSIEKKINHKPILIVLVLINIFLMARFTFVQPWTDFFIKIQTHYEEPKMEDLR
jgi:hypothetical protein